MAFLDSPASRSEGSSCLSFVVSLLMHQTSSGHQADYENEEHLRTTGTNRRVPRVGSQGADIRKVRGYPLPPSCTGVVHGVLVRVSYIRKGRHVKGVNYSTLLQSTTVDQQSKLILIAHIITKI